MKDIPTWAWIGAAVVVGYIAWSYYKSKGAAVAPPTPATG